jgi:hypothetical protein
MYKVREIIPKEERCDFCKKRKAIKLCDFPIYYGKRLCFRGVTEEDRKNWSNHGTCDKKICEVCATNIDTEVDFCPKCIEKLKKVIE